MEATQHGGNEGLRRTDTGSSTDAARIAAEQEHIRKVTEATQDVVRLRQELQTTRAMRDQKQEKLNALPWSLFESTDKKILIATVDAARIQYRQLEQQLQNAEQYLGQLNPGELMRQTISPPVISLAMIRDISHEATSSSVASGKTSSTLPKIDFTGFDTIETATLTEAVYTKFWHQYDLYAAQAESERLHAQTLLEGELVGLNRDLNRAHTETYLRSCRLGWAEILPCCCNKDELNEWVSDAYHEVASIVKKIKTAEQKIVLLTQAQGEACLFNSEKQLQLTCGVRAEALDNIARFSRSGTWLDYDRDGKPILSRDASRLERIANQTDLEFSAAATMYSVKTNLKDTPRVRFSEIDFIGAAKKEWHALEEEKQQYSILSSEAITQKRETESNKAKKYFSLISNERKQALDKIANFRNDCSGNNSGALLATASLLADNINLQLIEAARRLERLRISALPEDQLQAEIARIAILTPAVREAEIFAIAGVKATTITEEEIAEAIRLDLVAKEKARVAKAAASEHARVQREASKKAFASIRTYNDGSTLAESNRQVQAHNTMINQMRDRGQQQHQQFRQNMANMKKW